MSSNPHSGAASTPNIKLAQSLLGNSVGFSLAAKCIASSIEPSDARFPWPPFFENVSYAIELSLKAFVLCNGATQDECKKQIGHDLKEALNRARLRKLALVGDGVDQLVRQVGRHHKDRKFCYLGGIDAKNLPDVPSVLATVDELLSSICKQLPIDKLIAT